ncbi:CotO family spore coat protein [Neobacillus sp. PS3-40]|uniref:CotO family spore coat protein n=1 Tax=Neobacillus sp. PS3-40 TaxID=3070679 RepID=UPI0027E185EE|nr:CotO family spore coat protein [Neobacillus sp. PS3-40]WML43401.1 CotO family spore coat protein [Neobacillus sp. PS3-40]
MNKSLEKTYFFPLLYIQQPQMKSPKAKMQSDFRFWDKREPIKRKKETNDEEKNTIEGLEEKVGEEQEKLDKSNSENKLIKEEIGIQNSVNESNIVKGEYHPEFINKNSEVRDSDYVQPMDSSVYVHNRTEEKNEAQAPQKRVPFNEQGFEDKVRYLTAIPMTTVKILFEFIMTDKKYTGYFLSNKDNFLQVMQIEGKDPIRLPLHSLMDIRMIGI